MPKIFIIILSLLLSLILTLIPLPSYVSIINPEWVLLTLLFWTYSQPRWINVGVAWILGLIVDGLTGSLLGLHALAFVVVMYCFDIFYRRFRMFHLLQQSMMIGILVVIYWIIVLFLGYLLVPNPIHWSLMLNGISSLLCWPFYRLLGQRFHWIKG